MILRAALGLAAALFGLGLPPTPDKQDFPPWNRTPVATAPFSRGTQSQYGQLTYAGGLFLTAPQTELFGGLSGLEAETSADGRTVAFAAVSDMGFFLTFTGELDEAARLAGAGDMVISPLHGESGEVLEGKMEADAEDISRPPDVDGWLISFERHHRILAFPDPADPHADVIGVNIPAAAKLLPPNLGMEAIAALPGGRVLVGAEDGRMWLCQQKQDPCPRAHGKGGEGLLFYLTGLDYLPDTADELVASYRRPRPLGGVDSIIAHVTLLKGKAVLETLGELPPYVDNVEGISAVKNPGGGYRIYVVTDNNYSTKVPTRLLAFDWKR